MTEQDRRLLIVEDDPGLQSQMRWCFDAYDVGVVDTRDLLYFVLFISYFLFLATRAMESRKCR